MRRARALAGTGPWRQWIAEPTSDRTPDIDGVLMDIDATGGILSVGGAGFGVNGPDGNDHRIDGDEQLSLSIPADLVGTQTFDLTAGRANRPQVVYFAALFDTLTIRMADPTEGDVIVGRARFSTLPDSPN